LYALYGSKKLLLKERPNNNKERLQLWS